MANTPQEQALKRAIERIGGARAVARIFDVATQNVYRWRVCPADRVLMLEKLSGVPRHELRPDFYPPEDYRNLPRPRAKVRTREVEPA
jgi:DNA-binding transcriptional regulator YdaS (Cro superfamily)